MLIATIGTLTLATAGSAAYWIVGWIIFLALIIGLPTYLTRRRRNHRRPR